MGGKDACATIAPSVNAQVAPCLEIVHPRQRVPEQRSSGDARKLRADITRLMTMNFILPPACIAFLALACPGWAAEQTAKNHAPINNLNMYYEVHGDGPPLVLIHGGIGASEAFGGNVALLARKRMVIVPHMQGHGFTKDIDRPLRYEQMADDVAALVDYLHRDKVDIMGYSMGGEIPPGQTISGREVGRALPQSG